jgi:hypothetical protein
MGRERAGRAFSCVGGCDWVSGGGEVWVGSGVESRASRMGEGSLGKDVSKTLEIGIRCLMN